MGDMLLATTLLALLCLPQLIRQHVHRVISVKQMFLAESLGARQPVGLYVLAVSSSSNEHALCHIRHFTYV